MKEENDHYLHPMIKDHDVIGSNTYKPKETSTDYVANAIFLLHNGYISDPGITIEELAEKLEAKDKENKKKSEELNENG